MLCLAVLLRATCVYQQRFAAFVSAHPAGAGGRYSTVVWQARQESVCEAAFKDPGVVV